jgi:hypothetical protein
MLIGEPMWVKKESSGNGLEEANLELQINLNQWTEIADNYFTGN